MTEKSKSIYLMSDNLIGKRAILSYGIALLGYLGVMVALFLFVQTFGRQYQLVDMRNATSIPSASTTPKVLAPFEQCLALPANTEFLKIDSLVGTLELPKFKTTSKGFLYVISCLPDKIRSDNLLCNIDVGGKRYASIPFSELKKMTFVGFEVPQGPHASIVRVSVEKTGGVDGFLVSSVTPVLKWGYIGLF